MRNILDEIKVKAKALQKTIVLCEGEDSRVVKAAADATKEGVAKIVLLGNEAEIKAANPEIDLTGVTIVDPLTSDKLPAYNAKLCELRASKGMTPEQLESVRDPFFTTRTTRKVGMGIPLFKFAAEMTGGRLEMESEVGVGTKVRAYFKTDHLDFTPIGDMTSTIITLVTMNLHMDFIYRRKLNSDEFAVDTRQLKEILGDVPLNEPSIVSWIQQYINENTKQLTEV